MASLQELLSRSVTQNLGLAEILAKREREAQQAGQTLIQVAGQQAAGTIGAAQARAAGTIGAAQAQPGGFIGEVLSSVPREFFEKAIDAEVAGNSIFKGRFDKKVFSELGERAQKAMNFVRREAGKEVGETKKALRGVDIKVQVDDIVKSIDDEIAARTIGDISTLDDKDIKFLNEIKGNLGKG